MIYFPTPNTRLAIPWIISLFLFLTSGLFSQEYRFEHLTISDGLSENSVISIYQDNRGFLWFGTIGGLNRYDGYTFKVFKNDPKDSLSIGGNYIVVVKEDNEGTLWVGTYQGGLNRFVRETETFVRYGNVEGQLQGLADNSAISLLHDSQDRFWVGTVKGGLNLLNRETGTAVTFKMNRKDSTSIGGNIVNCLAEDKSGTIWVGSSHHYPSGNVHTLNRLNSLDQLAPDSINAQFTRYLHDPEDDQSLNNSSLSTILLDPLDENSLWIGTRHAGIGKFNIDDGTFLRYLHNPQVNSSLSNNKVYNMFFDRSNRLWIGTFGGGLNLMHNDDQSFFTYRHQKENPASINDDKVISITQDNSGNLWLGTHKAGINKLNFQSNQFRHFGPGAEATVELNSSFASAIYEDSNEDIWIGTQKGLNKYTIDTPHTQYWEHDPADPSTLTHNWVYAIEEDNRGNFWVGTYGGGLNLMDKKTGRFKKFVHDKNNPNSLRDNDVLSLKSQGDFLWIGTRGGGLSRLDLNTLMFKNYSQDSKDLTKISDNIVRDILIDKDGIFWLATSGGLNRFDSATERFTQFKHDEQHPESINNDLVITLLEYSNDEIWVGTINGLDRFNKERQTFERINGLPNNVIHTIVKDKSGSIWLSTNGGICQFIPETRSFKNYTVDDGLSTNEFNQNVALLSSKGEVFFGGPQGLVSFFPDSLKDNHFKPPVVLTNFLLFNQPVELSTMEKPTPLTKAISEVQDITLSWEDKVFSFEFAGLDFTNPKKNDYAYMMEGFDDNWIPAEKRRFATYTNLDPGEYLFRVKASNNTRNWNEQGKSLKITIQPPYWETWWFRLLVVLTAVVIPLLIYRNHVMNLLALERLRVRIASDLHDDIGGTLNAIVMQSELLKSGLQADKIPERVDKIGIMGREATRMLSDVVWSIDSRNDSLGDLVDHIKDFVDLMFSKQNIELSYKIEGLNLQKSVDINLRQNLYLISKEAISNIAKYAEADKVDISLINTSESFTMCISDNGKGDSDSTRRTGHGLRNMELRAERLNGTVTFQNDSGFVVLYKGPAV